MFNMFSNVDSDCPTLSPALIRFTSFCTQPQTTAHTTTTWQALLILKNLFMFMKLTPLQYKIWIGHYQDFNGSLGDFGGNLQGLEERGLLWPKSGGLSWDLDIQRGQSTSTGRGLNLLTNKQKNQQSSSSSYWILMSCQPHRVTSGQSNSGHKQIHISILFSHIYQPSVKSIYKTNHFTNIKHQTKCS